jgi:hypothetical protein
MALSIVALSPSNGNNSVPIDSTISIELTDFVDPFTVPNGVSIYVASKAIWDNPVLAELDTKYSEVLDIGEANTYFPFKFQIDGKIITITPEISLLPDMNYFIDILPGNDATRYLSTKTVGVPIVVNAASGTIDFTGAYTGSNNETFELTFSSSDGISTDTVDVSKGIRIVGSFKFVSGTELNIGELKFILRGTWDIGDSVSIPVFKAVGLTNIYRVEFITSKYTTTTPRSNKIQFVSDSPDAFRVVSSFPENMSMCNTLCNPIVLKFNKTLDPTQNISDLISIKRTSFDTGETKNITKYFKIDNDTVKIYMISTARRV